MTTLAQIRGQIAGELGAFLASTVTSGTVSTLTDTAQISSVISSAYYDDWYFFRPNALLTSDKLRHLATFDPLRGDFGPDRPWTNAPTAAEAYELHGFLDPLTQMKLCINEGLKRCLVTLEAALTPTALVTRHILSTLPWVDEEWKVRSVGWLTSGEDRTLINPYQRTVRGYVSNEGRGDFYINHPGQSFNVTDTLYLWTVASGYSQCSASSFPSGTQNGLNLDNDVTVTNLEWATQAALIEVYRRFSGIIDRASNQRLESDRLEAASSFTELTRHNFVLPKLTFRPLTLLGPLPSYAGSLV